MTDIISHSFSETSDPQSTSKCFGVEFKGFWLGNRFTGKDILNFSEMVVNRQPITDGTKIYKVKLGSPLIEWLKENNYQSPAINVATYGDYFICNLLFDNETEAVHFKMYWL